jgi:hypothetical protein
LQTRPPVRITGRQFCNAFSGLRIDSKSAFYCLTGARATRLLRMGLLAASTAGDALVVGIGRGAVLWRAGTATTLRGADDERCVAVAISGDGATVATASDTKRLRCWHNGAPAGEVEAPRRVSGLCIAPYGDGQVLLACCAGELYAFPLPALDKPPRRLLAHTSSVLTGVAYAGGLVATADRNEKVRISQFPRCEEIESFCLGHTDFVSGVEFLSGTRLVSCGGDGYLRVWDAATGDCVAERRVGGVCTCLAVSTAAVAVASQFSLDVCVYPFVEGVLAEDPFILQQHPDTGEPPSDLCFRGSSLVALVPGGAGRSRTAGREPGRRRPVGPLPGARARPRARDAVSGGRRRGQAVHPAQARARGALRRLAAGSGPEKTNRRGHGAAARA